MLKNVILREEYMRRLTGTHTMPYHLDAMSQVDTTPLLKAGSLLFTCARCTRGNQTQLHSAKGLRSESLYANAAHPSSNM